MFSIIKRVNSFLFKTIGSYYLKFKNSFLELHAYYIETKYRVTHIVDTNFNLALDHLSRNNLNDSLLRLKIVQFLSKPESLVRLEVNYLFAWVYFLKNNPVRALSFLNNKSDLSSLEFSNFLQQYDVVSEVPEKIWCQYRDFTAMHSLYDFPEDLYYRFVNHALHFIEELPDEYSILELGIGVGRLGYHVVKRFPENFLFTGVEESKKMNSCRYNLYPEKDIYNEVIEYSISKFLHEVSSSYRIVLSCESFGFTKNLSYYFNFVFSLIEQGGYFVFCLPLSDHLHFSIKEKKFLFTKEYIKEALIRTKFSIINAEELVLVKSKEYYIVVCYKNKID